MGRNEAIFDFVYDMAFNDATMRKAYINSKSNKKEAKKQAKKHVNDYLDEIFHGNQPDPFVFITRVVNETSKYGFTYGNAQKLVNMTAKYMYVACYKSDEKRELFSKCHCPMDSTMIKAVKGQLRGKMPELPDGRRNWSGVSWSKINSKDTKDIYDIEVYKTFQKAVADIILGSDDIALDFDYANWGKEEE